MANRTKKAAGRQADKPISGDNLTAEQDGGAVEGPSKRRRADARENRERILSAAIKVLASLGVDAQMSDIAQEAGVGVATLYRNFPNKEDLVKALVLERITRMAHGAEAAAHAPDAWEGLVGMIRWITDRQLDDRMLAQFVSGRVAVSADLLEQRDRVYRMLERVVKRAQKEGKLRTDVNASDIRMVMVSVANLSTGDSPLARRLVHRYLAITLDGLRAPGQSKLPGPPVSIGQSDQALHPEDGRSQDRIGHALRAGRRAWPR